MTYDSVKSALLVRQTDAAGSNATLAEIVLANQLARANDSYTIVRRALVNVLSSPASGGLDPRFTNLKVVTEHYDEARRLVEELES